MYGSVDPYKNETFHRSLHPTTNKQNNAVVSDQLYQRSQFNTVNFLVDYADYLGSVLAEDGHQLQLICHKKTKCIERVF